MNEDKRAKTHGIPAGKTGDIEHMNTISFLSCIAKNEDTLCVSSFLET